jgi:hypothetical protein
MLRNLMIQFIITTFFDKIHIFYIQIIFSFTEYIMYQIIKCVER